MKGSEEHAEWQRIWRVVKTREEEREVSKQDDRRNGEFMGTTSRTRQSRDSLPSFHHGPCAPSWQGHRTKMYVWLQDNYAGHYEQAHETTCAKTQY